jgi:nucleotide-binding universal stress UspA family protein
LTLELAGTVVHEITLLTVVEPRHASDALPQAEAYLQVVRDRSIGLLSGRDCQVVCRVLSGSPAELIIELAEADGKAVIMTTHAEAGIGRWTVGSTTDRVLRDGMPPILVLVHAARD